MTENEISRIVLNCALKIHKKLGPGLLESTYETCLFYELKKQKLNVEKQKPLSLTYEEINIESAYIIDLIVNEKVIIELKAVESIREVHKAQLYTYLKLSNCQLGLLLNFNVSLLKEGVYRMINSKDKTELQ